MNTPSTLGYSFPAEWQKHEATWLTWPYLDDSFPEKLDIVYPYYIQFIKEISLGEKVRINVPNDCEKEKLLMLLDIANVDINQIELFMHPTNDVWCRDHGPAFVVNSAAKAKKAIVSWEFIAWGGKYPADLDNQIPEKISAHYNLPLFKPGIIMEGGSVEFNGDGTILTTTACLLNKNRNPHLTKNQIEQYLCDYYGAKQILWLGDGIAGDDTDGHIDDITRFVSRDTVVTVIEENSGDENYQPLKDNLEVLEKMRLADGKELNIIELPMPNPVYHLGRRLPASYANFYISNAAVIVPTFRCAYDDVAIDILSQIFTDRSVIGIDSVDIVWGLGSFHCLSQQEPCV
jgi:agmatine deiminase